MVDKQIHNMSKRRRVNEGMMSGWMNESIANLGKPEGETSVFYGEEAIDMLLQDERDTTFYHIPLSEPRPAEAFKSEKRTRVSSWQSEGDEIELEVGIPRGPAICTTAIPASQLKVVCHDFDGYYTIYKGDKPLCHLRASMNNRDFRPMTWEHGKKYEEPVYVDEWNDYLGYEDEETPVNESIANIAKRNPEREEEIFYGEEALDLLLQDRNRVTYYYYSPERNPNENRWRNRRETELRKVAYRGTPSLQIGIPGEYAMFMEEISVSDLKVICHSYEDYYTVCDGEKPVANLVISSGHVVRPWKLEGNFPRRKDDYDDFDYEDEETAINESIRNLGLW